MKIRVYLSPLPKLILSSFLIPMFLLFAATQTLAKSSAESSSTQSNTSKPASPNSTQDLSRVSGATGVRRRTVLPQVMTHGRATILKVANKSLTGGCGCAVGTPGQEVAAGWGSCFKGCLQDAGASPMAIIMCGVACGVGGVVPCAVCVGVTVTVVEWCALGCATYPKGFGLLMKNLKHRHLDRPALQAGLNLRRGRPI